MYFIELLPKPVSKICKLLSNGTRRGSLAMRPTQHWYISILLCQTLELAHQLPHAGEDNILQRISHHHGLGHIVNILRGAPKMNVFLQAGQLFVIVKFLLQEILNGFNVVFACSLEVLDSSSVVKRELIDQVVKEVMTLFNRLNDFWVISNDSGCLE